MTADDRPQIADQDVLDEAFERALEWLEDGQSIDIAALAHGRTDLLPQIERMVQLARRVAVGQSEAVPAVPGYTILGELGHGGMGAVYLAQQERLGGRSVALKLLPAAVALSAQARARFRAEALAIARLRHPHIVAVHDVVEAAGIYAYAMEWIDGPSLAGLIDELNGLGRLSTIDDVCSFLQMPRRPEIASVPRFLSRIGMQVADALEAVHGAKLLHRDVKPSNILLRRDGTALLSDFGLARATDSTLMTMSGCFLGTPAYAAPEQLRGENDKLDPRADVYGLGATLYHALTGAVPVHGNNPAEVLRAIESGKVGSLCRARRDIPRDLATIIDTAVAPDRDRRYATAEELATDLRAFLAGEPIHAKRPSFAYIMRKRIRRNRVPVALGIVIGLMLVGLGGRVLHRWWSAYQQQFSVELRGPGVQSVDVAILGKNVPTSLPADTLLQVNVLRGLGANSEFPGDLGIGHEHGRHAGHVLVSAAQKLRVRGELEIGCGADGLLAIENGGAVECERASLGLNLGSRGEARLACARTAWNIREVLAVGERGPGVLAVGGQAHVTAPQVQLGRHAKGIITVAGNDALLVADNVIVGDKDSGRLDIRDGGSLSCVQATLANEPGAHGDANVSGPGALWATREDIFAGEKGTAVISIRDGGGFDAHSVFLGREEGSVGRFEMDGGRSCVRMTGWMYAGYRGTGSVEISGGRMYTGDVWLGTEPEANGRCSIRGQQHTWLMNGAMRVGYQGDGEFEIDDGAQVESLWGMIGRAKESTGRVVLTGDGSIWRNRASCALGGWLDSAGGSGEVRIEPGAAFIVEHELLLWPGGKLHLVGGNLAAEILTLPDSGGLEAAAGILGARTVRGDLHIRGATLASACTPGAIDVEGELSLESGALRIILAGTAEEEFDRARVSGTATLGGRLDVWLAHQFEPAYNDRLTVLTAAGIAGTFENVSPVLQLCGGGTCEVLQEADQLVLTHFEGPFESHELDEFTDACLLPEREPPTAGPFPGKIARNETAGQDRVYLGPPDDISFGMANGFVDFDFGDRRVIDGPGPDFNVYERDGGPLEFFRISVSVSDDGATFVDVKDTEAAMVRVPGDGEHGSDEYARSYDLVGSGLSSVRFIRVEGAPAPDPPEQTYGFDLDAIAAIHFVDVGTHGAE